MHPNDPGHENGTIRGFPIDTYLDIDKFLYFYQIFDTPLAVLK